MAGQSSIEEGRPGSRLVRHRRVSLVGVAVDSRHIAGQAMCQERPSRDEAQAQMGDVGKYHHQSRDWLIEPRAQRVLHPPRIERCERR